MRKILLLLCLLAALPLSTFASSCSDGEDFSCSCTDEGGAKSSVTDSSVTDETSCISYCSSQGAVSFEVQCGSDPAFNAGDIADYLESLTPITKEDPAIPALNVPIPGLDLSDSVEVDDRGNITTNMVGLYVNAVFSYGIVLATLFGVLMLTISGFQYMTAGGDKGAVSKAKDRMQNTIFGLILLMAAYSLAFLIDPRTTRFQPLTLQDVEEIRLSESVSGDEGSGSPGGGGTSWTSLNEPYKTIVATAKEKVSCSIPDLISSPTGNLPNQGNHHWYDHGRNGNYSAVTALDWAAPWGSSIYAPFEGTVTYEQQTNTGNPCGNRIYLQAKTGGASITICHAKDFVDDAGVFEETRTVEKGDVIGHVGGLCCSGQKNAYDVTDCNVSGTLCTDPTQDQDCSCQRIFEAGNTTGPHVHITFDNNSPKGMMLACLE